MADQDLTDGWGISDPLDDTLVRAGVMSLADRISHMARAAGRPVVDDGRWVASSLSDRGMFSTAGIVTRPTDDWSWVAPALAALGPPEAIKLLLSPFPTPDLRLDGLQLMGHPPFMVCPPRGPIPDRPPGLTIKQVQDDGDLGAFERILIEGYPLPDMDPAAAPSLFRPGYLGDRTHLYLGLLDGEPVATSGARVAAGVNHVEFIATLPAVRGRGIGLAMTQAASVSDPNCPAVLIASDHGRGVYESLSYLPVSRWTIWMTT